MKQAYNISVRFLRSVPGKTALFLSSLSPVYKTCRGCSVRINNSNDKFCGVCLDRRRRRKEDPLSFLYEIHI